MSFDKQVLRDWLDIYYDLSEAQDYITALTSGSHYNDIVRQSLWSNALVAYFRAFDKQDRAVALDTSIYKHLPGKPLALFEYFKNMRDAHTNRLSHVDLMGVVGSDTYIGHSQVSIKRNEESKEVLRQFSDFVALAKETARSKVENLEKEFVQYLNETSKKPSSKPKPPRAAKRTKS